MEKKIHHYFGDSTRSKNKNCIAKKAEPPKKCIKKANANIGNKHLRKSVSPGLQARSKPDQRRSHHLRVRYEFVTASQSNFFDFLK